MHKCVNIKLRWENKLDPSKCKATQSRMKEHKGATLKNPQDSLKEHVDEAEFKNKTTKPKKLCSYSPIASSEFR